MDSRNAVFVDLSNLNVIFKVNTKFAQILNYSNGFERLGESLSALGAGYDVYLSLRPRARDTGDMVLNELSMVGLPFTVDSYEVYEVLRFFRGISGVSDIYICNWLHDYISVARVATFESVFYYGEQVAYISVKDRLLENFTLYANQMQFSTKFGDSYSGHGDLGLVDADGIKAQYPELSKASKAQITAIAPLVQAYRTPMKLNADNIFLELSIRYDRTKEVEEPETENQLPAPIAKTPTEIRESVTPVVDEEEEEPNLNKTLGVRDDKPTKEDEIVNEVADTLNPVAKKKTIVKTPKKKTSLLSKVAGVVACLTFLQLGTMFSMNNRVNALDAEFRGSNPISSNISALQREALLYSEAYTNSEKLRGVVNFIYGSNLPIDIINFSCNVEGVELKCICASEETKSKFINYIESSYEIVDVADFDVGDISDTYHTGFIISLC